ncbi:DUF4249 family protein [Pedobacter mendelii]|uniref:DUF4249 domain-containing protein n=1 Tax=Pedobacter mendelii TaxID=1908240 RepID=A0ABQ2BLI0_9SPHI|nr:DUF4249 family protein [Pedobacter mendelii]GGI27977.1 hypothetical protein GCM10008119_30350 [Pedobacter mendelii]
MKLKSAIVILCFFNLILFYSCEKSVVLELETASPKLVVEADINLLKGTSGNYQKIKLSLSTPYYANQRSPVENAQSVTVSNSKGLVFNFVPNKVPGEYVCQDFLAQLGEKYELNITYEGKKYSASEQLIECPNISKVIQNEDGGFGGGEMEVTMLYTDVQNVDNQYMTIFRSPYNQLPQLSVYEDKFYQGVQMSASITEKKLKKDDILEIRLEGISKSYFNYLRLSLQNAAGANPFQAIAANARGNIINRDIPGDNALGYFRLSETDSIDYIIR